MTDIDFAEIEAAVKDLVDVVGYGTGDEPVVASAAFKNDEHDHRGRFAPKGTGVPVSDPDEAIALILDGKAVSMSVDDIGPLYERLASRSADEPTVDLGKVTIAGTGGLYCGHSKGIARADMPQLGGNIADMPSESRAAQLPPDERGFIDIDSQFRQHLTEQGVDVHDETVAPADLRPTQRELDGRKSAMIAERMDTGDFPDDLRIFVSREGYVVDGHHRWAAEVGRDARDGTLDTETMDVAVIDLPIMEVLSQALDFAEEWGIPQRSHGESALTLYRQAMAKARELIPEPSPVLVASAAHRAGLYQQFRNPYRDKGTGRFKPKGAADTPRRVGMGDIEVPTFVKGRDSAAEHIDPATGKFTEARQALHDEIINRFLDGKQPGTPPPQFTILGGGPAAGKSSLLEDGLLDVDPGAVTVNPDDMKLELPETKAAIADGRKDWAGFAHEESSYLAKRLQDAAVERGIGVILDGTGNGQLGKVTRRIEAARAAGYEVSAHYVTVPTDVAVQRSEARAQATGRSVPEDFLRRTHAGVSRIAPEVAPLVDTFTLHDTSGPQVVEVARQTRGSQLVVHDTNRWESFLAKANEQPPEFAVQPLIGVPSDMLIRMTVEILAGIPKEASSLTLDDAASAAWDAGATQINAMRDAGLGIDVIDEWPDPTDPAPVVEPAPADPPAGVDVDAPGGEFALNPADAPETPVEHTSGMLALYPRDAGSLVVEGGDPAEELHVTLGFLGKVVNLDDGAVAAARDALTWAARTVGPFTAGVSAAAVLGADNAVVLLLDAPELAAAHDAVWAELYDYGSESFPDQFPNWVPHLTLGYPADETEQGRLLGAALALKGTTIEFDRIGLSLAGDVTYIPLGTDTSAPQEAAMSTASTTFAAEAPAEGAKVRWTDEQGGHTGVVAETTGDGIAIVIPDGAPDDRVDVPFDKIEVAGPAPETSPAGPIRMATAKAPAVDGPVIVADDDETMSFHGLLVVEGVESGDRRFIGDGALTWRELPLPLMVMFRNPDGGEGHAAAELAGRIDKVWRNPERPNELWGSGVYDDSPVGREAYRLLKTKMMRGVSVDLDAVDITWEAPDGVDMADLDGPMVGGRMKVQAGRVMGATQTAFPAFAEAHLEIGDEALVASAGIEAIMHTVFDEGGQSTLVASGGAPERPPSAWFGPNANVDAGAYPVRLDIDGRIHGYVAAWGNCHIGFAERCVSVPKSSCSYSEFRKGQVLTAEGDLVATGPIVTDTVHPDLRMRASDAQAFYSYTGAVVGDVAVHEDRNGIYVAGAQRPAATSDQLRAFRGGDVSPDWRRVNGRGLECVAMLVVNNSGFKVTQALAASAGGAHLDYIDTTGAEIIVPGQIAQGRMELATGEVTALVAAGRLPRRHASEAELRMEALERRVDQLTSQLLPFRRARALAALGRDPGAAFATAAPPAPVLDPSVPATPAEPVADDGRFVEDGEFVAFEEPETAPEAAPAAP